jgi:hypothetical protein
MPGRIAKISDYLAKLVNTLLCNYMKYWQRYIQNGGNGGPLQNDFGVKTAVGL